MSKDLHSDAFEQRRIGLEEAFFKERDQQLLEKMRAELNAFAEQQKLAHISGINDEHILQSLVRVGVRAETLAAVRLIPQVEVAWCDGVVSPEESDAVLNAAVGQGISPDSTSYVMLQRWLASHPDPQIVTAWKDYVHELVKALPKETVQKMKKQMIDRCTRVAEAAGGFLGLSTISKHERAKIDEFARAWDESS